MTEDQSGEVLPAPEMSREIKVCDIPPKGIRMTIEPSEDEIKALMERFDLLALKHFKAKIEIRDVGSQGILITGDIQAELEQTCVATGYPVAETTDESFRLRLVGEDELALADADEEYYLDPDSDDLDLLVGEKFDAGEVVAQTLSIMMDPYPRAEGVEINAENIPSLTINQDLEKQPNPFAILSELKDKT